MRTARLLKVLESDWTPPTLILCSTLIFVWHLCGTSFLSQQLPKKLLCKDMMSSNRMQKNLMLKLGTSLNQRFNQYLTDVVDNCAALVSLLRHSRVAGLVQRLLIFSIGQPYPLALLSLQTWEEIPNKWLSMKDLMPLMCKLLVLLLQSIGVQTGICIFLTYNVDQKHLPSQRFPWNIHATGKQVPMESLSDFYLLLLIQMLVINDCYNLTIYLYNK